jgi:hypothetical protein
VTATPTPSNTNTPTPTPTVTQTQTQTVTPTNTSTATNTPTNTPTMTQTTFDPECERLYFSGTGSISAYTGNYLLQSGLTRTSIYRNNSGSSMLCGPVNGNSWSMWVQEGGTRRIYYGINDPTKLTYFVLSTTFPLTNCGAFVGGAVTANDYILTGYTTGGLVYPRTGQNTSFNGNQYSIDLIYCITNTPTVTPTNTPTPSITASQTQSPTQTPSNTQTQTNTPTNTRTQTVTPTNTRTPTPTPTTPTFWYDLGNAFNSATNTCACASSFPSFGTLVSNVPLNNNWFYAFNNRPGVKYFISGPTSPIPSGFIDTRPSTARNGNFNCGSVSCY